MNQTPLKGPICCSLERPTGLGFKIFTPICSDVAILKVYYPYDGEKPRILSWGLINQPIRRNFALCARHFLDDCWKFSILGAKITRHSLKTDRMLKKTVSTRFLTRFRSHSTAGRWQAFLFFQIFLYFRFSRKSAILPAFDRFDKLPVHH